MAIEKTFSIIKPDAVARNLVGKICSRFETNGLKIIAMRMVHMSRREAEGFYAVHKERPFFGSLCDYMTSGPAVVMILQGEGAIDMNRKIMGATDPSKADKDTIRADFGENIERNSVHGSDAPETAAIETSYFFPGVDMHSR